MWHLPWGLIRPVDLIAMWGRYHMERYGTTRAQLAEVAIALRNHAMRNPAAMMHKSLTLEVGAAPSAQPLHRGGALQAEGEHPTTTQAD